MHPTGTLPLCAHSTATAVLHALDCTPQGPCSTVTPASAYERHTLLHYAQLASHLQTPDTAAQQAEALERLLRRLTKWIGATNRCMASSRPEQFSLLASVLPTALDQLAQCVRLMAWSWRALGGSQNGGFGSSAAREFVLAAVGLLAFELKAGAVTEAEVQHAGARAILACDALALIAVDMEGELQTQFVRKLQDLCSLLW